MTIDVPAWLPAVIAAAMGAAATWATFRATIGLRLANTEKALGQEIAERSELEDKLHELELYIARNLPERDDLTPPIRHLYPKKESES